MRTVLLLLLTIILCISTTAQVTKVTLKAAGLTCSMCSNAINKALHTLEFVADVDADIKTYSFEISFKPNSTVDFDQVRKKVEKAGFSVTSFIAVVHFDNVQVRPTQPVVIGDKTFVFTNIPHQVLSGYHAVKILNPGFVSIKESKRNSFSTLAPKTYYATK